MRGNAGPALPEADYEAFFATVEASVDRLLLWMMFCAPVGAVSGGALFESRSLPVEHVYNGGWEHFVGGGVAIFDCNDDRFPDFFVAGGETNARLFVNVTGKIGAELVFRNGDVLPVRDAIGAYPLDLDNDGLEDLFVLRAGQNKVLKGGRNCDFSDITDDLGLEAGEAWSTAFSAVWEAGQIRPTLAVGNYVDRDDPNGPFGTCDENELHRPNSAGGYDNTILSPGFCALSMLFSDWKRTGVKDLRVSNDRHYYVRGGTEQMWAMPDVRLRDGPGWKPLSIWGMGIASQDLTGDGRPEVFLTSMGDQLMQIAHDDGYRMATFDIGSFAQRPYTGDDGRPSTGWHAEFGDVDNDGYSDLFIAKGNVDQMPGNAMLDPNNLLMQDASGRFSEMGLDAGLASTERSRGAGLSDFNRDGLLDLVVVNRRAPLELYQNTSTKTGAWLQIAPRQTGANGFAIGAWIEISSGGRCQVKELTVGGGHASGQAGPLHFGLGKAETAQVRVTWPDGAKGDWIDVRTGQSVELWRHGAIVSDRADRN